MSPRGRGHFEIEKSEVTMAEGHVAVLRVRRSEADRRGGWSVDSTVPPFGRAAIASPLCYFALGGADVGQMLGVLQHIGLEPHERQRSSSDFSKTAVTVTVLPVSVPERVEGYGGSVRGGERQQFVLPGRDYSETCTALWGGGLTLHECFEDARDLAIEDRWRSDDC